MFEQNQVVIHGLRQCYRITVLVALIVLGGCQILPLRLDLDQAPLLVQKSSPSTADILDYLELWCRQSSERRTSAMIQFDDDEAAARFEQMLIASCEPARFPGRLAIAVRKLQKAPGIAPAVKQVVAVIGRFSDSQQTQLNDITKLKTKLEETIQAIRVIEEGINQRTDEGVTP